MESVGIRGTGSNGASLQERSNRLSVASRSSNALTRASLWLLWDNWGRKALIMSEIQSVGIRGIQTSYLQMKGTIFLLRLIDAEIGLNWLIGVKKI